MKLKETVYVNIVRSNLNKRNLTAGAVQVETKLQEQLSDYLYLNQKKMFLKYLVLKIINMFALTLTVSEISTFDIFYLYFKK